MKWGNIEWRIGEGMIGMEVEKDVVGKEDG